MKKRWGVCLVTAYMLVVMFLGVSLKAEAGNERSGTLGYNGTVSWTYDEDTKTLTLTGEATVQWGYLQSVLYDICPDVEKIIVKDCKLYDCSYMFKGMTSVKSIVFDNFDTSQVTSMSDMFNGCSSLTTINISALDTSQVTDMSDMFSGCSSLVKLDVSGLDTSKVTNMGGMFSYCSNLAELDVSGFDMSQVTDMGSMFNFCSSLEELDVSDFDTSKVTDMSFLFYDCSSLTELDVSGFDTSQVEDMSGLFNKCSGLTELDVSGFETSKVGSTNGMFMDCSGLKELNMSNFDTSQVYNMAYMFSGCKGLTTLDLSNFDTSQVYNMNYMFFECTGLTDLDVSSFCTSQTTLISSMFTRCSSLEELDISNFDLASAERPEHMLEDCDSLQIIYTPKAIPEGKTIGLTGWFEDSKGNKITDLTTEYCNETLRRIKVVLISSIKLNENKITISQGDEYQLQATILPDNATNKKLAWYSSNTKVFTVDENGKVTAVNPGEATIVVEARDGSGECAYCQVVVTEGMSEQEKQVRAFVERMYTIVLNRPAEEQGLNDWTARLMAQELDGGTLVNMFVFSDEFIARNVNNEEYIKILYRAVLGREADEAGLQMWKELLDGEWTRDQLKDGFVLSDEFKALCDSYGIIAVFPTPDVPDNPDVPDEPDATELVRDFVRRMYTVVLNRPAEEQGLNDWTNHLLNGIVNGAQVADGFIGSEEFANRNLSNEDYVKVLYLAFFNREADEGGFNVWMNELARGVSRRDVMKGFVHSVEFSDLCAQYGIIRGEIQ